MPAKFPRIDPVLLAKYILSLKGPMSHLKLQKLLYYVEAWHLVFLDEPLIDCDFKAWVHGPVCLEVWHSLKDLSLLNGGIKMPEKGKAIVVEKTKKRLAADQLAVIADVLEEYGDLPAHRLEALTHAEKPWLEARGNIPEHLPCRATIKKSTMKAYYRSRLEKSKKG